MDNPKEIQNKPKQLFCRIMMRLFGRKMSDKTFIKFDYCLKMGKFPNLESPRTYNEKLQWLKLNYWGQEQAHMVDKYEAKFFVNKVLGGGILFQL